MGSADLECQIGPVQQEPMPVEDIAPEQDLGFIGVGEYFDRSERKVMDAEQD